jgi:hypothetical protein
LALALLLALRSRWRSLAFGNSVGKSTQQFSSLDGALRYR